LRTQIMPGVMEDDEDNGDDSKKWVSKEVRDSTLDESDYFTEEMPHLVNLLLPAEKKAALPR
jgi:hypothetical protein